MKKDTKGWSETARCCRSDNKTWSEAWLPWKITWWLKTTRGSNFSFPTNRKTSFVKFPIILPGGEVFATGSFPCKLTLDPCFLFYLKVRETIFPMSVWMPRLALQARRCTALKIGKILFSSLLSRAHHTSEHCGDMENVYFLANYDGEVYRISPYWILIVRGAKTATFEKCIFFLPKN